MGNKLMKCNRMVFMKFEKIQRIKGYNIFFSMKGQWNISCNYFFEGQFLSQTLIWDGQKFGILFSWQAILVVKRQHYFHIPFINLSSHFLDMFLLKIYLTTCSEGHHIEGVYRTILNFMRCFHSSSPSSRLLITNLAKIALPCITWSINPKPPWDTRRVSTKHATLGPVWVELSLYLSQTTWSTEFHVEYGWHMI